MMQQHFWKTHCLSRTGYHQLKNFKNQRRPKKKSADGVVKKKNKVHGIDRTGGPVSLDPAPMMKGKKRRRKRRKTKRRGSWFHTYRRTNPLNADGRAYQERKEGEEEEERKKRADAERKKEEGGRTWPTPGRRASRWVGKKKESGRLLTRAARGGLFDLFLLRVQTLRVNNELDSHPIISCKKENFFYILW